MEDGVLHYESPGLAQMMSHPYVAVVGAWLDFRRGQIVVKNPDDILVTKMKHIARQLGAKSRATRGAVLSLRRRGRPDA